MTRFAFALFCFVVAPAFGQAPAKLSLADLIEKVEPSCVRVDVETARGRGIGSGFIAKEGDWVITNHHVVAGSTKGEVSFSDNSKAEIEGFLAYDKRRDIAVLKIKLEKKRTPLELSQAKPRKGESAIAIGAPRGLSFTATEGIISAIRTGAELKQFGNDADGNWLQISVPISPGNSGGPLLNDAGEVIGANTAGLQNSQNLNFAISAADIGEVLAEAAKAKVQELAKIEPLPPMIAMPAFPARPTRPFPGIPSAVPAIPGGESLTIQLPAERRFQHRYKLTKETDEFDKITWLRSQWIPLKHNDGRLSSAAFRVGIPYNESGPTMNVIWEMVVTCKSFAFTNHEHRKFQMLVADGEKLDLTEPQHKAELNPQGGGWLEKMSTNIRLDRFLDLALAKKEAKGRLGPMEFLLGPEELECFRELLSKVPKGKVTDGGSTLIVDHHALDEDPTAPPSVVKAAKAAKSKQAPKEQVREEVVADEYRHWISADGKFTVEAKLIRVEGDVVRLQRKDDGRLVSLKTGQLSKVDQQFLAKVKQ